MISRPLGTTGINVPPLALGTVKLGRLGGLKYPGNAPTQLPTDDAVRWLLHAAWSRGIRLIDTAPAYGTSELRLGEILPQIALTASTTPAAATTDRWLICTKVGEIFNESTSTSTYDFSPEHIRESIQRSLQRLRVPMLDIVLLHFATGSLDHEILAQGHALRTLRELQHQGLIRAVGVSIGSIAGGELVLNNPIARCDVLMLTLNERDRAMEHLIARAHAQGLGVLIKKPLASGHSNPSESLRSVLNTPGVTAAVVGTANPQHLSDLATIADNLNHPSATESRSP
ncbi:MAG: aldo/keto reductase [Phycisphaerales bacterium]|nr:aldo/keto reductase [Phycisphaerales bacterium]